jgi:predicted nuclease of restriction endonuclease-like (RecB) superfamily
LGKDILTRQDTQGWGGGVINRLANDLRSAFPDMKGLSARNLRYMTAMVRAWGAVEDAPQVVAHLPWGHIRTILDKAATGEERDWYAAAAVRYGWSRNVLLNMMMNRSMERTGAAPSNFTRQLAAPDSEPAKQMAQDPYNFEFLGLSGEVAERDLENALTGRITETLQELGPGFPFVGRQVRLDVDGDDFYVDLLFFHIEQLRFNCTTEWPARRQELGLWFSNSVHSSAVGSRSSCSGPVLRRLSMNLR